MRVTSTIGVMLPYSHNFPNYSGIKFFERAIKFDIKSCLETVGGVELLINGPRATVSLDVERS